MSRRVLKQIEENRERVCTDKVLPRGSTLTSRRILKVGLGLNVNSAATAFSPNCFKTDTWDPLVYNFNFIDSLPLETQKLDVNTITCTKDAE